MEKNELGKKIMEVAYITGEFKLRSGQTSHEYFDKYRFESQPTLLKAIALELKKRLPKDTEVLGALETGGIPLATALSLETGLPVVFVRKQAKDYGTCKFAEGVDIKDKKLCVIEDVITTGGQVVESTKALRNEGAIIDQVLCVILRADNTPKSLTDLDLKLDPVFKMQELKSIN
ncbi:MAG: orotate phosphoribosyltransferase [Bdellovibrionales bacterium]|nr:orotate phosphoribosyltransferase [Bdellovibrionales bacterium]